MRQRAISDEQSFVPAERIEQLILFIRGEKVMLDASLAELYGVETGALNRAVKRNGSRFPEDFMFQLTPEEAESLRCHFGISKHDHALRSQNGVGSIYSVDGLAVAGDLWPQPDESRCPQEQ